MASDWWKDYPGEPCLRRDQWFDHWEYIDLIYCLKFSLKHQTINPPDPARILSHRNDCQHRNDLLPIDSTALWGDQRSTNDPRQSNEKNRRLVAHPGPTPRFESREWAYPFRIHDIPWFFHHKTREELSTPSDCLDHWNIFNFLGMDLGDLCLSPQCFFPSLFGWRYHHFYYLVAVGTLR